MKCYYCKGDIPDDARKCMHCGEWVREEHRPESAYESPTPGEVFGRVWRGGLTEGDVVEGIRWYVKYRIVMAVVGAIVFVIFLFAVFLPAWNKAGGDTTSPVGPTLCLSSDPTVDPDGVPACAP